MKSTTIFQLSTNVTLCYCNCCRNYSIQAHPFLPLLQYHLRYVRQLSLRHKKSPTFTKKNRPYFSLEKVRNSLKSKHEELKPLTTRKIA
uniref:Uncharacterized protein n=1 Tax=Arabidopsis thaliana TaxID=3702 RepID=Q56XN7_ARATH|nr:hypothetical protein [Arabidopsis thaliana]